jgi:hypothetical protein
MKLCNSRPFAIDRVYIENKQVTTECLTLNQTTLPRKLSLLSLRVHVPSALDHFYISRDLHVKTLCNNTYNTSDYTYLLTYLLHGADPLLRSYLVL